MKVILIGASGMVGQGVLRECLRDPGVAKVLVIGRSSCGVKHDKLEERLHPNLADLAPLRGQLSMWDACLFCAGVSSAGMKEDEYRKVTHDLTVSAARTLAEASPGMTFIYVSGAGTDSTEKGRSMWARVKGATENALLAMPFARVYMFRPGYIQPQHGIRSKTRLYRVFYAVMWPLYPLLRVVAGKYVTSTERVGRAMVRVARDGLEVRARVMENREIDRLGA